MQSDVLEFCEMWVNAPILARQIVAWLLTLGEREGGEAQRKAFEVLAEWQKTDGEDIDRLLLLLGVDRETLEKWCQV